MAERAPREPICGAVYPDIDGDGLNYVAPFAMSPLAAKT